MHWHAINEHARIVCFKKDRSAVHVFVARNELLFATVKLFNCRTLEDSTRESHGSHNHSKVEVVTVAVDGKDSESTLRVDCTGPVRIAVAFAEFEGDLESDRVFETEELEIFPSQRLISLTDDSSSGSAASLVAVANIERPRTSGCDPHDEVDAEVLLRIVGASLGPFQPLPEQSELGISELDFLSEFCLKIVIEGCLVDCRVYGLLPMGEEIIKVGNETDQPPSHAILQAVKYANVCFLARGDVASVEPFSQRMDQLTRECDDSLLVPDFSSPHIRVPFASLDELFEDSACHLATLTSVWTGMIEEHGGVALYANLVLH